jgi:hypothetical protein
MRFAVNLLILFVIAGLVVPASATDWTGKEVTKDGILNIMNPATPSDPPVETTPSERWRIGGGDADEDAFFGIIETIDTDRDGNIYLLDGQLHQVMIYSPDGEFIRTIGREGEGPGEFREPGDMVILPDGRVGVVQQMPGKIVLLTPEGDPADNFPFPGSEEGGTQMFFGCAASDEQVIVGVNEFARRDGGFTAIFQLTGVNMNGEKVATYYEVERKHDMAKFEFDEKEMGGPALQWDIGVDGRVYAVVAFEGYDIHVWNPDGSKDRIINKEFESRERSAEEMEKAKNNFRVMINGREAKNIVSETDRDIQRLYTRSDGTLWVLSSRGALDAPDGTIGVFDVFDASGKFTHEVSIKGEGSIEKDGYFFVGDRLFVVTSLVSARRSTYGGDENAEDPEEEPEPMAVICYDLGTDQHGMNR